MPLLPNSIECSTQIANNHLSALSGSDAAAWAQAIASTVAVIATFIVVFIQRCHQNERDKGQQLEIKKRKIRTAISLSGGTKDKASLLDTWAKGGGSASTDDLFYMCGEIQSILSGISSISLTSVDDFSTLMHITSLQSLAGLLNQTCNDAFLRSSSSTSWASHVNGRMQTLLPEIDKHLSALIQIEINNR